MYHLTYIKLIHVICYMLYDFMEAIVLSRRDFREFDQIVSLYTKDVGKIELLVRGVKKIKSKNSAHLEPFSYIQIEVAEGKELNHLTKVIPINFFANIRQNLNKSMASGFLAAVIAKMTEVEEVDNRIFELFLSWLKFVEKSDNFDFVLVDAAIINLFSVLGFHPILEYCVVCQKSLKVMVVEMLALRSPKGEAGGFYFAGGGMICHNCREQKKYIGETIIDCGLKEISNLQVLLKSDWRLIAEFNMEQLEQKKLHKLIYEFVVFHSEKRIDDWGIAFKHLNI